MRAVTRDGVDITRLVYLHRMNHLSILLQREGILSPWPSPKLQVLRLQGMSAQAVALGSM